MRCNEFAKYYNLKIISLYFIPSTYPFDITFYKTKMFPVISDNKGKEY